MHMRILNHQNKNLINNLVKAVQEYCNALLITPRRYEVLKLEDLNIKLNEFIREISPLYPECHPAQLQGEVHSYLTFEVYNLHYNDEKLLISITSRKTEFEEAFTDYDNERYLRFQQIHRYQYTSEV